MLGIVKAARRVWKGTNTAPPEGEPTFGTSRSSLNPSLEAEITFGLTAYLPLTPTLKPEVAEKLLSHQDRLIVTVFAILS